MLHWSTLFGVAISFNADCGCDGLFVVISLHFILFQVLVFDGSVAERGQSWRDGPVSVLELPVEPLVLSLLLSLHQVRVMQHAQQLFLVFFHFAGPLTTRTDRIAQSL